MSLTMRAGTVDDIDRLVEIYFSAFADNAVQHRVFPESSPQVRPFWRNNFVNDFKEDYVRFRVMEQPSSGDSEGKKEIVAFAIWNAPRKPTDPIPAMPPREAWPSDGDQDAAVEFFHDLERQHKSYMAHPINPGEQQPHWYLELIATHRDHQGKGAAGALLRWGEQQADEQGVPCYLDATPDGRPVYTSKGHGFREVESRTYFGGVYEHVFMIRDPKKKDE
ncbi:hypothetical protein Sste5346_008411 [Sporothrix stenoceras]|uniref:N-acetyltransferase domain-containing protein n=1 Tax=Sporothrix stenoceras TaxID=5173 RepID=A0ABR3YRY4_9PEZI